MNWMIIGLVCNSLGCYWAKDNDLQRFYSADACVAEMKWRKQRTAMYFDMGCTLANEVKSNGYCPACIETPTLKQ